jgi:hypothetical protein
MGNGYHCQDKKVGTWGCWVVIANSKIIQQHQNVVIYSSFKPAWLLDIIELSKLQILE